MVAPALDELREDTELLDGRELTLERELNELLLELNERLLELRIDEDELGGGGQALGKLRLISLVAVLLPPRPSSTSNIN